MCPPFPFERGKRGKIREVIGGDLLCSPIHGEQQLKRHVRFAATRPARAALWLFFEQVSILALV